jgi:hypothetical protein
MHLFDATPSSLNHKVTPLIELWRIQIMKQYKQLLLFDLEPYTCVKSNLTGDREYQVEVVPLCVEYYQQLELDLFSQPSYKTSKKFLRLAA